MIDYRIEWITYVWFITRMYLMFVHMPLSLIVDAATITVIVVFGVCARGRQ